MWTSLDHEKVFQKAAGYPLQTVQELFAVVLLFVGVLLLASVLVSVYRLWVRGDSEGDVLMNAARALFLFLVLIMVVS